MLCLVTQLFLTLCNPMDCNPTGFSVHGDSPGKNTGVGCYGLLRAIFSTQGLNPVIPHCRRILCYLCHQENPRILDWVACPFSRGSSRLGIKMGYPADRWPSELPRSPYYLYTFLKIQYSFTCYLILYKWSSTICILSLMPWLYFSK